MSLLPEIRKELLAAAERQVQERGGSVSGRRWSESVSTVLVLALVVGIVAALGAVLLTAHRGSEAPAGGPSGVGESAQPRLRTYRSPAGWTIDVPRDWHLVPFSLTDRQGKTVTGIQISNLGLPAPSLVPGVPIQVNARALPRRGIGVIIATDDEAAVSRHRFVGLPLPPVQGWLPGSALVGNPHLATLWFTFHGTRFIATAKIGPKATGADLAALNRIMRSITPTRSACGSGARFADGRPPRSITSVLGSLSRPASPGQRISRKSLRALAGQGSGIYARYARKGDINGVRYYLIPMSSVSGGCSREAGVQLITHDDQGESHSNLGMSEIRRYFETGSGGNNHITVTPLVVPNSVATVTADYPASSYPGHVPHKVITQEVRDNLVIFVLRGGWDPPSLTYRSAHGAVLWSTPAR